MLSIVETLKRRKRRFYTSINLALSAALLVSLVSYAGYFEKFESWALDILFRLRGQFFSSEIVLVEIDDDAFSKLKERQPLSRAYLASLISVVDMAGAKVIGLDVELKLPTNADDDKLLLDAIRKATTNGNSKVVPIFSLAADMAQTEKSFPVRPIFYDHTLETVAGFGDATIDSDGLIREVPLVAKTRNGHIVPSFAIGVLARYAGHDVRSLDQAMNTHGTVELNLPEVDRFRGRLLDSPTPLSFTLADKWKINYAGGHGSFAVIPSEPLFEMFQKSALAASDNPFRDKIVLIGATFRESRDYHATPFGMLSGVEIHANIINTILTRSQVRPTHRLLAFVLILGFGIATSVLVTLFPPIVVTYSSVIAIPVILIPLSYLAFSSLGLWVDFVTPLVVVRFGTLATDFFQRRHMRQTLRAYLHDEILSLIVNQEDRFIGQTKEVTVVFTDVQDYTTLAENLSPERVFGIMNQLFVMMSEVVTSHQGIIIDFIGDSLVATFGALKTNSSDAQNAVLAAIEIQERLKKLNDEWQERDLPALRVRVGIHTGEVFIGVVGSDRRKKLDIMGDTVNAGARVEGLNKQFETSILLTRETLEKLDGKLSVRRCGEVIVRGRQKPIEVFEIVPPSATDNSPNGGSRYEQLPLVSS